MKGRCLAWLDAGTGRMALNCVRSCFRKASGSATGRSSGTKKSPGSLIGDPKRSSAGEAPMSSFRADRSPSRTDGRSLGQGVSGVHMRAAFSVLCQRSTIPLAAGWYGVVWILWAPILAARAEKSADSNCVPCRWWWATACQSSQRSGCRRLQRQLKLPFWRLGQQLAIWRTYQ